MQKLKQHRLLSAYKARKNMQISQVFIGLLLSTKKPEACPVCRVPITLGVDSFRHTTAYPIESYRLIIGERTEKIMTPTMTAITTMINGSITAIRDCTAISTSSS